MLAERDDEIDADRVVGQQLVWRDVYTESYDVLDLHAATKGKIAGRNPTGKSTIIYDRTI